VKGKRLALTLGEPAGIGPDICLQMAQTSLPAEVVVVGSSELLLSRAKLLGLDIQLYEFDANVAPKPNGQGRLAISEVPLQGPCIPGELNVANSKYVLNTLQQAYHLCASGHCDALVTGPLHKAIINLSGVIFSGHTEYLASLAGVDSVLMTFYTPEIILALATTHHPLNKVATLLTKEKLSAAIRLLHDGLVHTFARAHPKINVLGLNPHAGESGILGQEENTLMRPLVREFQQQGWDIRGPVSADTAFTPQNRQQVDAILAMYHDQGLAPIKALYFGEIVNITLGLPFLRTSVDHGTALDLAGTTQASAKSLLKAIATAAHFCARSAVHA
jgi:4-hydroxythreonine-4-phosphate dehydrogenase